MALWYHWALGIGHIHAHSKEDGIRDSTQSDQQGRGGGTGSKIGPLRPGRSQAAINLLYMKTQGSPTWTRNHFAHLDDASNDEVVELTLGDCEALDWDLDREEDSMEANKANGDWDEGEEEGQDNVHEELGSEHEWIQDVE